MIVSPKKWPIRSSLVHRLLRGKVGPRSSQITKVGPVDVAILADPVEVIELMLLQDYADEGVLRQVLTSKPNIYQKTWCTIRSNFDADQHRRYHAIRDQTEMPLARRVKMSPTRS